MRRRKLYSFTKDSRGEALNMIPDNDWYGHKYILSLYCGRPLATAIFGSVMHGWVPELGDAGHRRVTSAPLFVWNEMLEADAVKTGVPNVRAIGAPFLYLAELLGQSGPSPTGRGTLCFPFHSAERYIVEQGHRRLIDHVEATEPGPYSVSIFYQDLKRPEYRKSYEEAGWRIVSFGDRSDPLFLFRLYAELLCHQVVIADQLGTSVWYAGALGRRVRVSPDPPAGFQDGRPYPVARLASRYPTLHNEGLEPQAAQEEAFLQLGRPSMLSPSALSESLGWQSRKRFYAFAIGSLIDKRVGDRTRMGAP